MRGSVLFSPSSARRSDVVLASSSSSFLFFFLLLFILSPIVEVMADIGILSFWVPELYALLDKIREDNNSNNITDNNNIETTYIYGARKFYVTKYGGHNIVIVNTGVGISNAAMTTTILLQKFPTITKIIGSGIAGGIDPKFRVGDVVIPKQWALYHKQHFAKEMIHHHDEDNGPAEHYDHHEIPDFIQPIVMGDQCGAGYSGYESTADLCTTDDAWNYTFMYPTATYGADPDADNELDQTSEGSRTYWWFDVDDEMYEIAKMVAPNVTLFNELDGTILDYQPIVRVGNEVGAGVSGPTFLDNVHYREYCYEHFNNASAVDMESAAAAHVAKQMNGGIPIIFFRSLSDLAGAEQDGNVMSLFFGVAAANAVTMLTAFLDALPPDDDHDDHDDHHHGDNDGIVEESVEASPSSSSLPIPRDHQPGEDTDGLLGVLSFYKPELDALLNIMESANELVYGGRKFYRGTIAGANVVAVLTGISISNAAMTTSLMIMLYPGVERIVGGGIAGGIDPNLNIGDVVIPTRWALYQMQLYAKEVEGIDSERQVLYEPPDHEYDLLVGKGCGGSDGLGGFLMGGDRPCNISAGEASNFEFMFPKSVQTPVPDHPDEEQRISEGTTRRFWLNVDDEMYDLAVEVSKKVALKNDDGSSTLPYDPKVVVGGNGVSGPTFVDNVRYRQYLLDEFEARCVDMETAAAMHVAYQNSIPSLFFRSLSDLAGGEEDNDEDDNGGGGGGNAMDIFMNIAAENAFAVTYALIEAMYPLEEQPPPTMTTSSSMLTTTSAITASINIIAPLVVVILLLVE